MCSRNVMVFSSSSWLKHQLAQAFCGSSNCMSWGPLQTPQPVADPPCRAGFRSWLGPEKPSLLPPRPLAAAPPAEAGGQRMSTYPPGVCMAQLCLTWQSPTADAAAALLLQLLTAPTPVRCTRCGNARTCKLPPFAGSKAFSSSPPSPRPSVAEATWRPACQS